jgi:CubicO group peptidase (beta-lactamase class C family)
MDSIIPRRPGVAQISAGIGLPDALVQTRAALTNERSTTGMIHIFSRAPTALALVLFSCLASADGFAPSSPEALGMSADRLERLAAGLEDYVAEEQLAGSVTLVVRHGKIAFFEAFGHRDRASGAPMKKDTVFRIASQTKAIVSTAILVLQEEGKLLITDPVGRYLPEFMETTVAVQNDEGGYDVVPADRPITIRDLLTHTSGYDYGTGVAADRWAEAGIQGYYFAEWDEPVGATVARMATLPASAQPGTEFVYGYSTDILGAVVEKVANMPLDTFLETRLFRPLGMVDTWFYLPAGERGRLATVYANEDGKLSRAPEHGWNGQGAYVDGPRKSFSGGAGLLSTAMDYARFLQMILNGGEFDGVRILSPKTVELMSADHLGEDVEFSAGQGFGLGFSVLEDLGQRGTPGSVGELGWGGAYHTSYWIDPVEELVVVYMTQLLPDGGLDDHARLRALVYQAIVE